jgi:phosphoribosylamine--glycine ligase
MPENILIVGSGGREHAIEVKLRREGHEVFVAPGNGGTKNNIQITPNEFEKLADFAVKKKAFTVVGPDMPLANGIVDYFESRELQIYGPNKNAAAIESSKAFAKSFMAAHGIPTASYKTVTDLEEAKHALGEFNPPYVLKADGLAAGKGVIIAATEQEAISVLHDILKNKKFGEAGKKVIIEQFLRGEEASYFVFSDGKDVIPLMPVRDYKQRDDNNVGPNTGGMGGYAPHRAVDSKMESKILKTIIKPAIDGLNKEGRTFRGTLYTGLMIQDNEPLVLEFNARWGDPETQILMVMMESPLLPYLKGSMSGGLKKMPALKWKSGASVNVVMASGGYPESYEIDKQIKGLENVADPDVYVFHAGTKLKDKLLYTNGGRVLNVVATAATPEAARLKAYGAVKKISWQGEFHRMDIGLL